MIMRSRFGRLGGILYLSALASSTAFLGACSSNEGAPPAGSSGAPQSAAGSSQAVAGSASSSAGSVGSLGGATGVAGSSSVAGANGSSAGSTSVAGSGDGGGAPSGGGAPGSSAGAAGMGVAGAAGASASATGCAGKTYKLCEDFESSTVGGLPTGWTSFKGYGTASAKDQQVASDQFHSGAKALKSTAGTKGTSRIQKSLSSLGATATKHWGRIYFKVQSPSAALPATVNNGYLHTTFVSLMGGSAENRIVDTVEQGPSHTYQWLYNLPSDAQGSGTSSAYDYTFDEPWHCAEWYVDVGTKSYRFFYDSKEITKLSFTNKDAAQMANYTSIIVGTEYYQDATLNPAFVAWFDDIAIDDTQIHCN